jgi:hypothetical protein
MKTNLKQINIAILLLMFTLSAQSQTDEKESNYYQLQNTMSNNMQQSSYNLVGFEGRAIQKLEDFANYLEIISNKEYDITLRKHALSLAGKLFYNDNIKIKNSDKLLSSLSVLELNEYLNSILKNGYAKITVEISNQSYIESLKQSKSDSYSGKLLFEQTNTYIEDNKVQEKKTEKKEVDIILIRKEKEFGKKTIPVWNVFLGDIKIIKDKKQKIRQ